MPNAKNNVQDMSINDPLQKISVKMTFYFNIFKRSILDFSWELPITVLGIDVTVLGTGVTILGIDVTVLGTDVMVLGADVTVFGTDVTVFGTDVTVLGIDVRHWCYAITVMVSHPHLFATVLR